MEDDIFNIDPINLNDSFVRLPGDLAYAGALYKDAVKNYLVAKRDFQIREAELRLRTRALLKSEGSKITESIVEATVLTNPAWAEAKKKYIESEAEMTGAKLKIEAIKAKRDMLIQMGAQYREEMKADPQIRSAAAARFSSQFEE
jgi:hypothetical protein